MDYRELLRKAEEARENAYVPYSGFRVGAALVTAAGDIYTGCNVENATYGATICAERTAVVKAVSNGDRDIRAIAVSGDTGEGVFPCGICRQFLAEFGEGMEVIIGRSDGDYSVYRLSELLPHAFTGKDLGKKYRE